MAQLVAIFGATASGKSAVAIELAELVGGEIVSCDSMQVYRGLPILTNQPTPTELARVPHHMVGVWDPSVTGSVAAYSRIARDAVDDIRSRGRLPIVAGGTGLYLRAVVADLQLPSQPEGGVRERFAELYDRDGPTAAHARLAGVDARAAAAVHPNDRRRVVRALELHQAGASLVGDADRLWATDTRLLTLLVGLEVDRQLTASRIARRTRAMFDRGVVDEVRSARASGPFSHTAERIHGLQDVSALIAGEVDQAEAERRLEVRTRRYSKRQRTWMRRLVTAHTLDGQGDPALIGRQIANML
jgi:tRNA dimethylallyltransferase